MPSAGFGVMLIGFVGMNILLRGQGLAFPIGHVGGSAAIIAPFYVIAMRAMFLHG